MRCKSWTKLEERRAVTMRTAGKKVIMIARVLGRSIYGVRSKLSKLNCVGPTAKRRKDGMLAAAVRRLSVPGVSDAELARRLRIKRELIYRTRKRLGIPPGVPRGGRHGPVKKAKSPNERPRCWQCDARSAYCAAGKSLRDQGWYCKFGSGGNEVYCPECVSQYGTPDQWAPLFHLTRGAS